MQKVEVIIPIKNEENKLVELIDRIAGVFKKTNAEYHITIIDDHSTDQSFSIAKKLSKQYPIKIYKKVGKPGKAFSILEGVKHTNADYIVMIDADLQYPPEAIGPMLKKMTSAGAVVANRKVYKSTLLRRIASRTNKLIFGKILFGLDCDIQSGLKVFRREIISRVDESTVGPWTLDLPLLYRTKLLGYEIESVDITFELRESGESKVSIIKTAYQIATDALKLRLKALIENPAPEFKRFRFTS